MESNWRYGVWVTGQSSGRFTLCARIIEPGWEGYWLAQQVVNNGYRQWVGLEDTSGYVMDWFPVSIKNHPGFPYEFIVEPD